MSDSFLRPGAFNDAYYTRSIWIAEVPVGTTLAQILEPTFWSQAGDKILSKSQSKSRCGRGDIIEVFSEDGELDVELRVLKAEKGAVQVRLRGGAADVGEAASEDKRLPRIEWAGPAHKWRVLDVHGQDHAHGLTKEEAQQRLDAYLASSRIAA